MIAILTAYAVAGDVTPARVDAVPGDPLPGITVSWRAEDCALRARIANDGSSPAVVDWMQSTITEPGEGAVGLVASVTPTYTGRVEIPVTVAPVGGFADIWVFRIDRLPYEDRLPCTYTIPSTAVVSLRIGKAWASQQLDISVDADELARKELRDLEDERRRATARAREEADEMAADCRARTTWAESKAFRERRRSRVFGSAFAGGTVAFGLAAGVAAAEGSQSDTIFLAGVATTSAVVGGVLYFLFRSRADSLETSDGWEECP